MSGTPCIDPTASWSRIWHDFAMLLSLNGKGTNFMEEFWSKLELISWWIEVVFQKRTQFAMKRTRIGFQGGSHPRVWVEFSYRQNMNWFRHHKTWEPSGEFFCRSHRKSEVFLVFLILEETSLERAFVVRLIDPWSEDESWSNQEDHVVEIHRALGCKSSETPPT
jgi:hypothetical protein